MNMNLVNIRQFDEFEQNLILHTISIKELDKDRNPIGSASGCLINYKDHTWLLSVFHAVSTGEWGLELYFDSSKKSMKLLYPLKGFTFLKSINISKLSANDVDFAFRKMGYNEKQQLPPKYQEISPGGKIIYEIDKKIFNTTLLEKPKTNKRYGFAGLVKPYYVNGFLVQQLTVETNILFKRERGDMYCFELQNSHPGHEYYQGCSGAPIMDEEGNLISLVIGGNIESNEIYGVNLSKFKITIDVDIHSNSKKDD